MITEIPLFSNLPDLAEAKCRDTILPDLFFPDGAEINHDPEQVRMIQEICCACPVQVECLRFALDNDEQHGYWGGFSPKERFKMSPPETRVTYAAGFAVMRDLAIGFSLEDACLRQGILTASFEKWKMRQENKMKQPIERKDKQ